MAQTSEQLAPFVRPESGTPLSLSLDLIDDNPWQPRLTYDEGNLNELATSIRADGLMQPVVVRRAGGGRYQLIAGHRRLRAFKALRDRSDANEERRFANIPALLRLDASDDEMARLALNENLQRDELLPTEAAYALASYRDMRGLKTAKEVAAAMGLDENRVKRLLRLHDSPGFIRAAVSEGLVVDTTTSSQAGITKRARRRLDLLGALEFARLYRALVETEPKKAEPRTRAAIERALRGDWALRRITAHVNALMSGDEKGNDAAKTDEVPVAAPVFRTKGTTLTLELGRLSELTTEDRDELRTLLAPVFS